MRAIVLFLVIAVLVLSAALPALAGAAKAPKPFHDPDFKNFGKIHVKYEICFNACHKSFAEAPHDLCGVCHDVVAECGACHAVAD